MTVHKKLTLLSASLTETTSGETHLLMPMDRKWVATLSVGTVGGESPKLNVKIQQKVDGGDWVDLVSFTEVTESNKSETKFAANDTDYLAPLLPYVKALATIEGTDPSFADVVVNLYLE